VYDKQGRRKSDKGKCAGVQDPDLEILPIIHPFPSNPYILNSLLRNYIYGLIRSIDALVGILPLLFSRRRRRSHRAM